MEPTVWQDFTVIDYDEEYSTLSISSGDIARVLLFAAQWLDQHRNYILDPNAVSYVGATVQTGRNAGVANVLLHLRRIGGHRPAQLGPWAQVGP